MHYFIKYMDIGLFLEMLKIDSTSGKEGEFADFLVGRLGGPGRRIETFDVGDETKNILVSWGTPKVVFCSHLDTVPPYIPPTLLADSVLTKIASDQVCRDLDGEDQTCKGLDGEDQTCKGFDGEDVIIKGSVGADQVCRDLDGRGSVGEGANVIRGRGTCDAKGQIFSMYEACKALEAKGYTDFALLLLAGEETGSHGAKAFNRMFTSPRTGSEVGRTIEADKVGGFDRTVNVGRTVEADKVGGVDGTVEVDRKVEPDWVVIVGEPTDNCMASAAKGTKSFEVAFTGKACHSGYPENGQSAIEYFNDFMNALRSIVFPKDEILGETTWNIGKLISDNPQNILSDKLTCRIYFRTTFESDEMVCNIMKNIAGPQAKLRFGRRTVQDGSDIVAKEVAPWQKAMSVEPYGGDTPSRFEVLEGFPSKPVAFGSDAPQLTCFKRKILCGPGSILVAHKDDEHIMLGDLETAIENYIKIYMQITSVATSGKGTKRQHPETE